MRTPFILLLFLPLLTGTTYVLKDGDREVGRMEEPDGRSDVEMVSRDAYPARLGQKPEAEASRPAPKIPATHPWYSGAAGYQTALRYQETTGDPVLVYFYTTWCPYCRQLEKDVLKKDRVRKALGPVLKAQIDAEKDRKLAQDFGVEAYPRLFVRYKDGKIKRIQARGEPESFLKECRKARLRVGS